MAEEFTASHRGGSGPPLVLLHGFLDTWRTWDLVLPDLERRYEVLALTLPGHAGGPAIDAGTTTEGLLDAVEQSLDQAGITTAHIAGNSLGGFVALKLAERARARSVIALAPAGGTPRDAAGGHDALDTLLTVHEQSKLVAPHVDRIVASPAARRQATARISVRFEHLPPELIGHQLLGVAGCAGAVHLAANARRVGWELDPERIDCPVRIVWGTEDALLPWPSAAARYREDWLPVADWVVLDGVGHCPQLDVPEQTAELIAGFPTPER